MLDRARLSQRRGVQLFDPQMHDVVRRVDALQRRMLLGGGRRDWHGGQACDTQTNTCTTTCSSTQACNGGCCSIAGGALVGSCVTGASAAACGASGVCSVCTSNGQGHLCVGGTTCGCNSSAECPS